MQGHEDGGGFWAGLFGGGFWAVLTGAVSVVVGMVGGAWAARGTLDAIQQRVATLERDRDRCQSTLKEDIMGIVQQAIDRQSIHNGEHLQAIRTELAVLVALHGETQKDVQALFDRLDRRQRETILNPQGERRDK